MMYIDNEVLEKMIMTMVEGFNRLEKKLDRMNRLKDCLDRRTPCWITVTLRSFWA